MDDLVLYEVHQHICRIILNRPGKHNCIDLPMLRKLDENISAAQEDAAVKTIILCGAGHKALSSGADIKAFRALSSVEIPSWIRFGNELMNRISGLNKPTIAVVQGFAFGGGMELALACDFRIATPAAQFRSPELLLGWVPGWGGMIRLRNLVGEARAKEIAFLGEILDANDALRVGLVTRIVSAESLEEELRTFAARLTKMDGPSFAAAKAMVSAAQTSAMEVELQVAATMIVARRESVEEQTCR